MAWRIYIGTSAKPEQNMLVTEVVTTPLGKVAVAAEAIALETAPPGSVIVIQEDGRIPRIHKL